MRDKPTGSTETGTILVVDDNPANVRLLADILLTQGHRVFETVSGELGLEVALVDPPDLILLDVNMPDMDGYEVCARLKAHDRTRHIPVMFISALNQTENVVRGFEVGGIDYITKPFRYSEILARVASQLTLVRQRREIEAMHELDRQHYESLGAMKTQFISMATHDLRNPLNVIRGYVALLRHLPTEQTSLLDECVEGIEHSVEKMQALVSEMLDLAKMERRAGLVMTPVSLNSFLAETVDAFQMIAAEKGVQLAFRQPTEDAVIQIDKTRMTRAMDNLISNAIKYTPAGGRVEVVAQVGSSYVLIHVIDTGIGVSQEDLPHLFEAFYRVDRGDDWAPEGTGLGLSIVKTVIEQHGGQIVVESEPGEGSAFTILLPCVSDSVRPPVSS